MDRSYYCSSTYGTVELGKIDLHLDASEERERRRWGGEEREREEMGKGGEGKGGDRERIEGDGKGGDGKGRRKERRGKEERIGRRKGERKNCLQWSPA